MITLNNLLFIPLVFTLVGLYKCFVASSETQTFDHFNSTETHQPLKNKMLFIQLVIICCLYIYSLDAFVNSIIYLDCSQSVSISKLSLFLRFSGWRRLRHIKISERKNRQRKRRNRRGIPLVHFEFLTPFWIIVSFNDSEFLQDGVVETSTWRQCGTLLRRCLN